MNYADFLKNIDLNKKNIEVREPMPGLRHNTKTIHVRHRFPVNGGINFKQSLMSVLYAPNPLFELLTEKHVNPSDIGG